MSDWDAILARLEGKRRFAASQGGADRIARHRESGKLTARERVEALFDDSHFVELGALAANLSEQGDRPAPADGLIAGFGRIGGRMSLAMVEDFTVMAGSIGDAGAAKRERITRLALQERVPLVIMLEGAGHRLTNAHATPAPNDLQVLAELSGNVPIVTLVMGPSAGHGALAAPLADFAVMTRAASLFVAGPPLVKVAIGEEVTTEQLGGPDVHLASGVVHNLANDDGQAIAMARAYLAYINRPQVPWEGAEGPIAEILDLVDSNPRRPFDALRLLELIADPGSLMVIQPRFGASLVTALARLAGRSVSLVANNPMVLAGSVDSAAAQKAAQFLQVADAFGLPVIFLADTPGIMPGCAAERSGTLRHAARMFAVQHALRVPKIHVTLRKAFGFGSSVMAMNPFDGQTLTFAFPAISLGAMPAQSRSASASLSEDEAEAAVAAQGAAAWTMADKMVYDEIIDPRDLRIALIGGLELAAGRVLV